MSKFSRKTIIVLSFLNMLLSLFVYINDGRTIHGVATVLWTIAFAGNVIGYQRAKSVGENTHE